MGDRRARLDAVGPGSTRLAFVQSVTSDCAFLLSIRPVPKLTPPALVTFEPDDYHAEYVGVTADGCLASVTINDFGPRATLDHEARIRRRDALLASLGDYRHAAIRIAPFEVEAWGVTFGLVLNHIEDEGEEQWQAVVEPGNCMCSWAPWTDGLYDT